MAWLLCRRLLCRAVGLSTSATPVLDLTPLILHVSIDLPLLPLPILSNADANDQSRAGQRYGRVSVHNAEMLVGVEAVTIFRRWPSVGQTYRHADPFYVSPGTEQGDVGE
jgi:hypothetical protein